MLALSRLLRLWPLNNDDVLSLGAFIALGDYEFNLVSLVEVSETVTYDGSEMDENVLTTFSLDEAEAFRAIEPFYGSLDFVSHEIWNSFSCFTGSIMGSKSVASAPNQNFLLI